MSGARGEMAGFYGLPNTQAGCLTDAKAPGPQAVMEKLITTLPLVLSGVDYIQGPGALETSGTLCLEQIVVDEEIARLCKRLRDGVDASDENLGTEAEPLKTIHREYLNSPHTLPAPQWSSVQWLSSLSLVNQSLVSQQKEEDEESR